METTLHIDTSKSKLWGYFFASLGFVAAAAWILVDSGRFSNSVVSSELVLKIIGVTGALFFGFCAIAIGRKLSRPASGIVIDDRGITLNEHGPDIGLIEWDDIQGFKTYRPAGSPRMLVLLTDQPEKYIDRAKSKLARKNMQLNSGFVGSPLWINTDTLKMDHDKVAQIIADRVAARHKVS